MPFSGFLGCIIEWVFLVKTVGGWVSHFFTGRFVTDEMELRRLFSFLNRP